MFFEIWVKIWIEIDFFCVFYTPKETKMFYLQLFIGSIDMRFHLLVYLITTVASSAHLLCCGNGGVVRYN